MPQNDLGNFAHVYVLQGPYNVTVKTVTGEQWSLPAYDKLKVSKLKLLLCDLLEMPDDKASTLKLSYKQEFMADDKTLQDYKISPGDTVALLIGEDVGHGQGQQGQGQQGHGQQGQGQQGQVVDPACAWCQPGQEQFNNHPRCPWCNPGAAGMHPGPPPHGPPHWPHPHGPPPHRGPPHHGWPPHHRSHHGHWGPHHGHWGRGGRGGMRGWWQHHLVHYHGMPPPAKPQ